MVSFNDAICMKIFAKQEAPDSTQPDDQYLGLFKALKTLRQCRASASASAAAHAAGGQAAHLSTAGD